MRSKELEEYKKQLKLNGEQREVLIGILLGDAHLETQNGGKTYRLKIEQSENHREYVSHLYRLFEDWVRTPPQLKQVSSRGHQSCNWWFQTLSHEAFRFYAHQFVRDGKKIVPKLIHRWLTPKALAFWYMDDGSVKSEESKGAIFNTQGFQLVEIERLCLVLNDVFELQAKPRKQKDGYQIYVSGKSFEVFSHLVAPYLIEEMRYKLPRPRQT